jgi:hypothetical protein
MRRRQYTAAVDARSSGRRRMSCENHYGDNSRAGLRLLPTGIGSALRRVQDTCHHRRARRVRPPDRVAAFLSTRSFQAACRAPVRMSRFALASRMWVAPIRPQPPATGMNRSGASATNSAWISGVSARFPKESRPLQHTPNEHVVERPPRRSPPSTQRSQSLQQRGRSPLRLLCGFSRSICKGALGQGPPVHERLSFSTCFRNLSLVTSV